MNDNHPLTNDTYDWGDGPESNNSQVERVLTALWDYSIAHPDVPFGTIIARACGGSPVYDVSNERFIAALKVME